jgi:hypothetical protein
MIRKSLFITLNLLVLFTPDFIYLPKWTWIISLLGLVVLFDDKVARSLGLFRKPMVLIISLWMVSFSLSLVAPIIHNTYDFSYSTFLFGLMLAILRGIFVAYIGVKFCKINLEQYIKLFVDVCFIYVLITFTFIILPNLKDWWFNSVIFPVYVANPEYYPFRIGIEGFAGFSTAQIFSLGLLLSTFLLVKTNKNKVSIIAIIKHFFIIIGCFLYGRITIVSIVLSILFLLLFSKNKEKLFKVLIVISLFTFLSVNLIFIIENYNPQIYQWRKWAFEGIDSLLQTGKFTTNSSNILFEKMFFLVEPATFLIGDGLYMVDGHYYMRTDVGFMRPILFFGFIGLLSNYSMLVVLLNSIKRHFQLRNIKTGVVIMVFILVNAFLFEVKGEVFHRFIYCLIPFYCISISDSLNDCKNPYNKLKRNKLKTTIRH